MGRGPSRRRRRARSERCGLEARVGQRPGSKGPAPGRFVGEAVGGGGGGAEPGERGPLVRGRRARRASKAAVVVACLAAAKARQAQCGGWGEDAKTKVGEEEGERVGVGLGSSDRSGGRRWVVRSRARPPALSPCPRRRRRSHGVEESAMSRLAGSVPPQSTFSASSSVRTKQGSRSNFSLRSPLRLQSNRGRFAVTPAGRRSPTRVVARSSRPLAGARQHRRNVSCYKARGLDIVQSCARRGRGDIRKWKNEVRRARPLDRVAGLGGRRGP